MSWIEPNRGQFAAHVDFAARAGSWQAGLRGDAILFASSEESVTLRFAGARPPQAATPEGRQPGISSYFFGQTSVTGVPHYARVRYRGVYPGIDLVYYTSSSGKLEYDFELAPSADPRRIRIQLEGIAKVQPAADGGLILMTPGGHTLLQRKPLVYELQRNGRRQAIDASYSIDHSNSIRFEIAQRRDRSARLVIDPIVEYSTFLGGAAFDAARAIACDGAGSCYLAGEGRSRTGLVGPLQSSASGGQDVVVAKINHLTNTLAYFAVIGGDADESATSIAIDERGSAYIAGVTRSPNFPTRSAAQPSPGGGPFADGFAAKLTPDGSGLLYATYVGGTGQDNVKGLAIDRTGAAYLVGSTSSRDGSFPITQGALQTNFRGGALQQSTTGYVAKLNPAGNRYVYATFLGGSHADDVRAIAVDEAGAATVAGNTRSLDFPTRNAMQSLLASAESGFVARLNPEGSGLVFSTYYGGPGVNSIDALALDGAGSIVMAGSTNANGFQTRNAVQPNYGGGMDGIIVKLSATAGEVIWATYLGGAENDSISSIAVHRDGSVTCAGATASPAFPQRFSPFSPGGKRDAFVTRISAAGDAMISSMMLGGAEDDHALGVALDAQDTVLVTGWTASRDFPARGAGLQNGYGGGAGDMFLVRSTPDLPAAALSSSPIVASVTALTIGAVTGSPRPPAPGQISVTSLGPTPVTFTVDWTVAGQGNWLSAGPQRAETPAVVSVFANPATLPVGSYQGLVCLTPVGGGPPVVINITLQVANPAAELTSLSPAWTPVGPGELEVNLRGRGFLQGAVVRISPDDATFSQTLTPTAFAPNAIRVLVPRTYFARDSAYELRVLNPEAEPSNPVALMVGGRALQVAPAAIVGAATGIHGPVAPGQMVLITGSGMGPAEVTRSADPAAFRLAGVRVLVDGLPAPLIFVSDRQICLMMPYAVAQAQSVEILVESHERRSAPMTVPVTATQPGIFTADSWVYGFGSVLNEGGSENAPGAAARKGSVISFLMTGAGVPAVATPDGRVGTGSAPAAPVTVQIDGQEAEVIAVGDAVGQVTGMVQVRARVPAGARSGEVPLVVRAGEAASPPVRLVVE